MFFLPKVARIVNAPEGTDVR